jgi:hypothetical protein
MKKILLLVSALSASLYGCYSQPTTQRSECEHLANVQEYDTCMRRLNVHYDTEQKAKYK